MCSEFPCKFITQGGKMNNIFVWTDEIVEIYDDIVIEDIEVSLSLS